MRLKRDLRQIWDGLERNHAMDAEDLFDIKCLVKKQFGCSMIDFDSKSKQPTLVNARWTYWMMVMVITRGSYRHVAALVGKERTTVMHVLSRMPLNEVYPHIIEIFHSEFPADVARKHINAFEWIYKRVI